MISLTSTPEYIDAGVTYRWLATESPNNFRLFRQNWLLSLTANNAGFLEITTSTAFTGLDDDAISVFNAANGAMYVGTITNVAGNVLTTDIAYVVGMNITYMNDNTLYGGYYFEGRLTINDVIETLTVIASPDSFGYADLDVSGLLRIATALGKVGDYTDQIMKETTKSGKFTFEYRGAWSASDESYTAEGETWYYAEAVRSEEQGSNLHEYIASLAQDAPFFNLFENPVYFLGLPFDLSFMIPELAVVSPTSELTVTLKIYNSVNTQIGADIVTYVTADALEGFVNSLNIDEATIPAGADHMTAVIEI